jgi:hypothetical protein
LAGLYGINFVSLAAGHSSRLAFVRGKPDNRFWFGIAVHPALLDLPCRQLMLAAGFTWPDLYYASTHGGLIISRLLSWILGSGSYPLPKLVLIPTLESILIKPTSGFRTAIFLDPLINGIIGLNTGFGRQLIQLFDFVVFKQALQNRVKGSAKVSVFAHRKGHLHEPGPYTVSRESVRKSTFERRSNGIREALKLRKSQDVFAFLALIDKGGKCGYASLFFCDSNVQFFSLFEQRKKLLAFELKCAVSICLISAHIGGTLHYV